MPTTPLIDKAKQLALCSQKMAEQQQTCEDARQALLATHQEFTKIFAEYRHLASQAENTAASTPIVSSSVTDVPTQQVPIPSAPLNLKG